jgi:hypothetical protein
MPSGGGVDLCLANRRGTGISINKLESDLSGYVAVAQGIDFVLQVHHGGERTVSPCCGLLAVGSTSRE